LFAGAWSACYTGALGVAAKAKKVALPSAPFDKGGAPMQATPLLDLAIVGGGVAGVIHTPEKR
jgi:hypothetical protein